MRDPEELVDPSLAGGSPPFTGRGVRLLATDIDGTLVRRDGSPSPRTLGAVKAATEAGLEVVLVTARPPRWVDSLVEQLGCHPLVVCSNGALLYDAVAREVVAEHALEPATAAEVIARLRREFLGVAVAVEVGLGYGQEPHYLAQWPVPTDAVVALAGALVADPVAKLIVRHAESGDPWELMERARRAVGGLAEVSSSGRTALIEITAAGVNKALALEIVAGRLGAPAASVVAFGDMPNDLPMLAWAGRSVAPANAHADVLAMVDHVTEDCEAEGVALVIEAILDAR